MFKTDLNSTSSSPADSAIVILDLQQEYQHDVYLTLSKWVSVICAILSILYVLATLSNTHPWPLFVAFQFGLISIFTFASPRLIKIYAFTQVVRVFLVLATLVIFSFSLLQPKEFLPVALLGSTIVIILSTFLEPFPQARFWAYSNIAGYVIAALLRSNFAIPQIQLGVLHD